MAKAKAPTVKSVVGEAIKTTGDNKGKGFDTKSLEKFKKANNLSNTAAYKKQTWIPLSDAFNEAVGLPGIPEGQIILFRGLSDTGKAQPLTSKVLTPNGWITMGEINKGDTVMDSEGNHQTVEGVYPQGIRPVYKVIFSDGSEVMCDEEHLWAVNRYRQRTHRNPVRDKLNNNKRDHQPILSYSIMETKEMLNTVRINGSKNLNYMVPVPPPFNFVSDSNLPLDPYIMGLILGDGSITKNDGVTLCTIDKPIVESLENNEYFRVCIHTVKEGGKYIDTVKFKKEIVKVFELNGLLGTYSETKFIPKDYIYKATVNDRVSLLQGLLDSDGTCDKRGVVEYVTSSPKLMEDFIELVQSLGGIVSCRSKIPTFKYKGFTKNGLRSYCVTVRLPHDIKPFRLERKLSRMTEVRKPIRKYIASIEFSHEEECQCIKVSNSSHLYVTDGYTITHNTTAMCEAATSAQKMGKLVVFIINEMKFSFDHLKNFGFETTEEVDTETGEIIHTGNFIYADRLMLPTIESIGKFILDIIAEQEKGSLMYDIVFAIDSLGSLPSDMSVNLGKNDARWNSAATSLTFGSFVNFKFPASRRLTSPFTNTLIVVNKQGIQIPSSPMEKPKRTTKGGSSMYFDAGIVFDLGGVATPLTAKIEATRNGKSITFAKRTKISVDKNHVTNSTATSKVIMTDYGFIKDTPAAINKYKEEHKHEWLTVLGGDDFDVVQEADIDEDKLPTPRDIFSEEE